jgi:hypothetical protein
LGLVRVLICYRFASGCEWKGVGFIEWLRSDFVVLVMISWVVY